MSYCLLGIELDDVGNGTLAYGAEVLDAIVPHSTGFGGAPDTFEHIAAAFVEPDLAILFGHLLTNHIGPLGSKVNLAGDVGFPWFDAIGIDVQRFVGVGIFIGQTSETVTELMDHHGAELSVLCHGEVVHIEDAATTILGCVDQNDYVLVGQTVEGIVETEDALGCEVTVGVKSVEVGLEGGVFPNTFGRLIGSALGRGGHNGPDVESIGIGGEGLVVEDGFGGLADLLDETWHLLLSVPFGHKGYVDGVLETSFGFMD